jgi:hypothetical protein
VEYGMRMVAVLMNGRFGWCEGGDGDMDGRMGSMGSDGMRGLSGRQWVCGVYY